MWHMERTLLVYCCVLAGVHGCMLWLTHTLVLLTILGSSSTDFCFRKRKGGWTQDKINLRRVHLCPVYLPQVASGMAGELKENITIRAHAVAWSPPNLSFNLLISACDPEATWSRGRLGGSENYS